MNKQLLNRIAGNASNRNSTLQFTSPEIQLANQHWSDSDGVGFTVDHLRSLGSNALASVIKLEGLYSYLQLDPYDSTQCRFRGMAAGNLFVDSGDVSIIFSDSTIHQQSDNVEHPDKVRELPAIPLKEEFRAELEVLVETAYRSCAPSSVDAQYGFLWKTHLLRLQPTKECAAKATPPVPHKDNARWVFVVVLGKENIKGGMNILYNNRKEELARFTLSPLQYFALDDRRHYHHVEDVCLDENAQSGYRDALVIEINTLESTQF